MKAIIILSVICFVLFLGLLWCISSIHNLCGAIKPDNSEECWGVSAWKEIVLPKESE